MASQTWGVSKVNRPDDFARLTYLNSLLSLLTGGASSKTEQITAVLRFLRAEDGPDLPPADYDANVARIVELHDPGKRRFSSIVHWDLRQDSIDPLWLRANVLEKLDKLTAHSRGLLVGLVGLAMPVEMRSCGDVEDASIHRQFVALGINDPKLVLVLGGIIDGQTGKTHVSFLTLIIPNKVTLDFLVDIAIGNRREREAWGIGSLFEKQATFFSCGLGDLGHLRRR